jgi:hypothetical protein
MTPLVRRGDPRLLGFARVAMGTILLLRTTPLANFLGIPLARLRVPLLGWPQPGWAMAWGGLVVNDRLCQIACVVRTVAGALFLLGIRARVAGIVAGTLGLLALSQDPFGFIFTLYVLFVGTVALALTDASGLMAIRPDPLVGVRSSVTMLSFVLAAIYGWSAIAKLRGEWLGGSALLALAEDGFLTPQIAHVVRAHATARIAVAWGAAMMEMGLAAAILHRTTRRKALVCAIAMHFGFELAVRPDVMGWIMASLLLAAAAVAVDTAPVDAHVLIGSPAWRAARDVLRPRSRSRSHASLRS